MYIELLQEKINWWNEIVAKHSNQPKDRIKVKYIENGRLVDIPELDLNLVYIEQEFIYEIRLETVTELFIKKSFVVKNIGRCAGFEYVAEQTVKDLIVAGLSHSIQAIRELHSNYPEQFPYGRFTGG